MWRDHVEGGRHGGWRLYDLDGDRWGGRVAKARQAGSLGAGDSGRYTFWQLGFLSHKLLVGTTPLLLALHSLRGGWVEGSLTQR